MHVHRASDRAEPARLVTPSFTAGLREHALWQALLAQASTYGNTSDPVNARAPGDPAARHVLSSDRAGTAGNSLIESPAPAGPTYERRRNPAASESSRSVHSRAGEPSRYRPRSAEPTARFIRTRRGT